MVLTSWWSPRLGSARRGPGRAPDRGHFGSAFSRHARASPDAPPTPPRRRELPWLYEFAHIEGAAELEHFGPARLSSSVAVETGEPIELLAPESPLGLLEPASGVRRGRTGGDCIGVETT